MSGDLFGPIQRKYKKRGTWSLEEVKVIASTVTCSTELKALNYAAWSVAQKRGWLTELGFEPKRKPNGYWTKSRCAQIARKYRTRTEFQKTEHGVYHRAWVNGWLNDICVHMEFDQLPNGYWSKEHCQEVAHLCKTRDELRQRFPGAYNACHKRNWIDSVCSEMSPQGHKYARYVYEIWSLDKRSVYVGITVNPHERFGHHRTRGPCMRIIAEGAEMTVVNELTPAHTAQAEEGTRVAAYRKAGLIVLNKIRTGGLGHCK